MKILILEDEPIIAIDLEDIVGSANDDAECVLASTVDAGLRCVEGGVDFALLDIAIGHDRNTSFSVAALLMARGIPFCFVSSGGRSVPTVFRTVPFVSKPFRPETITGLLPAAA